MPPLVDPEVMEGIMCCTYRKREAVLRDERVLEYVHVIYLTLEVVVVDAARLMASRGRGRPVLMILLGAVRQLDGPV